jgi:hypothetical protein
MLNFCIRSICLLTASLMATHALSQDISNWPDKIICRLVISNSGADYLEEASSRALTCKAPIKTKSLPSKFKSNSSKSMPPKSKGSKSKGSKSKYFKSKS